MTGHTPVDPEAQSLLREAFARHSAGRLAEAEPLYRRFLARHPDHPDALHLLGVLTFQLGRAPEALDWIGRALALQPSSAAYHSNLAMVLVALNRPAEAMSACAAALHLQPDYPEALFNRGAALQKLGRVEEAVASYQAAIARRPNYAEAHNALGAALAESGRGDLAVAAYRRALEHRPDFPEALNNLGNVLGARADFEEAARAFHRALALRPNDPEVMTNLGAMLEETGRYQEAADLHRRAIDLRPDSPQMRHNLANALNRLGDLDGAIEQCREALRLNPRMSESMTNLGTALKDSGRLDEAVDCFRRSLEIRPDAERAGALLYSLYFHPDNDPRAIFEEHVRWNDRYARPLARFIRPHANDRDPDRRLRIGYVATELGNDPVGRFLLPLLANHDHERFEIFFYCNARGFDFLTDRLRSHLDHGRRTIGMTDEQMADAIRRDGIDVLIDLSMHTHRSRLAVFARKPAPVQATWLAYCGTTGLETMDWRLSDPYLDPPGTDETCFSERTLRLPRTFWCYGPSETPEPSPLPAQTAGHVTFGCLNSFAKVGPAILPPWFDLLRRVPDSCLLLHARRGSHRATLREKMKADGIDPDRVDFVDFLPPAEYFARYGKIDIALDTFPYGGGTTTCDALWMGAPVVSLRGRTAMSRAGYSILSNIGLPELVTDDPRCYVSIAEELAGDLPRLTELRRTLRPRMLASPLMDAPQFARDIEAAYRHMWRTWCEEPHRSANADAPPR